MSRRYMRRKNWMTIVLDWGHVHENCWSDLHSTWVCVQHWYASSVYQYSWFHLSRNVNSYNNRYWSEENPMLIHEEPSNDTQLVFDVQWVTRIIRPVFLT
jgi:hypothetical protein